MRRIGINEAESLYGTIFNIGGGKVEIYEASEYPRIGGQGFVLRARWKNTASELIAKLVQPAVCANLYQRFSTLFQLKLESADPVLFGCLPFAMHTIEASIRNGRMLLAKHASHFGRDERLDVWLEDKPTWARRAVALQIWAFVQHLEKRRVTHTDVKPENFTVCTTADGVPKLVGLDFESIEGAAMPQPSIRSLGTRDYQPPELIKKIIDYVESDRYAAAITTLETLGLTAWTEVLKGADYAGALLPMSLSYLWPAGFVLMHRASGSRKKPAPAEWVRALEDFNA